MGNWREAANAVADLVTVAYPELAAARGAVAVAVALTDRSADQLREISDQLERNLGAQLSVGLVQLADAAHLESERERRRQVEDATQTLYRAWIDVSETRKHPRSRELMAAAAGLGIAWAARSEPRAALRYLREGADHAHDLRFAIAVSAINGEMEAAVRSAQFGHEPGTDRRRLPTGRQAAKVYFTYGLVAARDGRRARQPYRNFRHLWRQRGTQSLLAMLDVIDTAEPRKRLLEAASMAGALDDACRVLDTRYDRQIQCPRCGAEFWLDWRKAGPVTCSKCDHEVMPGPADRTLTALLGP